MELPQSAMIQTTGSSSQPSVTMSKAQPRTRRGRAKQKSSRTYLPQPTAPGLDPERPLTSHSSSVTENSRVWSAQSKTTNPSCHQDLSYAPPSCSRTGATAHPIHQSPSRGTSKMQSSSSPPMPSTSSGISHSQPSLTGISPATPPAPLCSAHTLTRPARSYLDLKELDQTPSVRDAVSQHNTGDQAPQPQDNGPYSPAWVPSMSPSTPPSQYNYSPSSPTVSPLLSHLPQPDLYLGQH